MTTLTSVDYIRKRQSLLETAIRLLYKKLKARSQEDTPHNRFSLVATALANAYDKGYEQAKWEYLEKACACVLPKDQIKAPQPGPNVEDLQECLAGFMALAAINGAYMLDEAFEWFSSKLRGKERSPMMIWRGMFGNPPSPTMPTIIQDIQDRLSALGLHLSQLKLDQFNREANKQITERLLNECHNLIAEARKHQTEI